MKSIKKMSGALAVVALAVSMIFTGCQQPTAGDATIKDYTKAGAEITVNAGEEKVIYVKGAAKFDDYTCAGLTITADGDEKFTLKVDEKADDATATVNFNDGTDDDEGTNITVTVYNPVYYVNMTLDDTIAAKANTISVYYEGKEDSEETAALYETVSAEYEANATTAVVPFTKAKASASKWFNGIKVTVKDADGNEIECACATKYFCYSAKDGENGYVGTMAVTAAVSSKTFTINFDGFEIPGGSVTGLRYSTAWASSSAEWDDANVVTPTVTVAEDGKSATFVVAKTNEFYINWTEVAFADKDGNAVTISSGLEDANKWYSYDGDTWSITATVVAGSDTTIKDAVTVTLTGSSTWDKILTADDLSSYSSISAITVNMTGTNGDVTDAYAWWFCLADDDWLMDLAWSDTVNGYSAVITNADDITSIKTNGLSVYGNVAGTAKITIVVTQ